MNRMIKVYLLRMHHANLDRTSEASLNLARDDERWFEALTAKIKHHRRWGAFTNYVQKASLIPDHVSVIILAIGDMIGAPCRVCDLKYMCLEILLHFKKCDPGEAMDAIDESMRLCEKTNLIEKA